MRYFTLLLACAVIHAAYAQPMIGSGNNNFLVGDQFTYRVAFGYELFATGEENTMWDLSGFSGNAATPSQFVDPPPTAPEGTIVTEINGSINFHYAATEEAFGIIGLDNPLLTFTCSDPITLFAYPFTMGGSREDPVNCAGQFQGNTYTRTGSISLWGASWGTLALPYGSFDNVLMVQMVVDYEETVENDPQSPYFYQALTQMFLKPGIRAPMLIGQQAGAAQMLHENSIGIHEALRNSIGLELFPNPAHDRVELVFGIGGGSNIRIALIDITGREVFSKRLSTVPSGAHREMLDLNGIPAGTYLVRISDEKGASGVQRLVVD